MPITIKGGCRDLSAGLLQTLQLKIVPNTFLGEMYGLPLIGPDYLFPLQINA